MENSGVTVSVGSDLLLYFEQRLLKMFGKDYDSVELANWFKGLQTSAFVQTSTVQILGMRNPLPFESLYQPTRLIVDPEPEDLRESQAYAWSDRTSVSIMRSRRFSESTVGIKEFLRRDQDAVILSGPGWGKTTFLHHIFRSSIRDESVLPVLITLRRPKAVEDLERYVENRAAIQKKQHRACALLLVDGYDEVNIEQRKRVAEALLNFQAQHAGKFYLTCREYYQLPQLAATEVRIDSFTREDQIRFVGVFLAAFERQQSPQSVISELEARGFAEFLSHPLLLTLACIVKTSSSSVQPRSALRLLERALEVLCNQWDEQKYIDRQRSTALDGTDRLRILKNIAAKAKSPYVPLARAEEVTRHQLALLGMDKVDPRQALIEVARFYGILVPAEDGYEFVHRTIHDFLAAKQCVESGEFAKTQKHEWNARTGYAACFVSDATEVLRLAFEAPDGLPAATEIIGNAASFDRPTIAVALINYFSRPGRILFYERLEEKTGADYDPLQNRIVGQFDSDFIRLANSRFLDFLVEYCCEKRSPATDLLVAYSVGELYHRIKKLRFKTYEKALAAYKTERFTFHVAGAKQAQLDFLNPVLKNRMKDYKPGQTEPKDEEI
jgi:hypothetical protein